MMECLFYCDVPVQDHLYNLERQVLLSVCVRESERESECLSVVTHQFTFLYFKKKLLTCSLCTPEGEKRWGEGETSPSSSLC